jgi:protoporphyrinogen oxidase
MATKVWGDPGSIDPLFVAQRFVILNPLKILSKFIIPTQRSNPSTFFYPRKGFQQLWDQALDHFNSSGGIAHMGSLPTRIEVDGRRIVSVSVKGADGKEIRFDGAGLDVASTIPVSSLLASIRGLKGIEELRAKAKTIKVRSMLLIAVEFDQPRTMPYRTLIFPERRYCFNRLFEQNQYSESTVSSGKSVVVADITLPRGSEKFFEPDEDIIAAVTRDMAGLSYIDTRRISDVHVERVEFAYVVPDLTTRQTMNEINHELGKITNLWLLGRFSAGEYDNSDYAIDNGLLLGAVLSGNMSEMEYLVASHGKRGRHILE